MKENINLDLWSAQGNIIAITEDGGGHIQKKVVGLAIALKQITSNSLSFDQILCVQQTGNESCDYDIYNNDGSSAMQCGNGARCLLGYLYKKTDRKQFSLKSPTQTQFGKIVSSDIVEVEVGRASRDRGDLEKTGIFTEHLNLVPDSHLYSIEHNGKSLTLDAISMGNPHAVLLGQNVTDSKQLGRIGDFLNSGILACPQGINVSFVNTNDPAGALIYERGVGFTESCGSALCAIYTALNHSRKPESQRMLTIETIAVENFERKATEVFRSGATISIRGPIKHLENYLFSI